MFNFRMTDSMAAEVEGLDQVLRDLRTTSPENFGKFRVMLRVACSEVTDLNTTSWNLWFSLPKWCDGVFYSAWINYCVWWTHS